MYILAKNCFVAVVWTEPKLCAVGGLFALRSRWLDPLNMSEAPAWETSKENVLPIKKGRSAKGLSESLMKPVIDDGAEAAEMERRFEAQLTACHDTTAKLHMYMQFIKWVREAFPTTTSKVLKLLEVRDHVLTRLYLQQ
jgi:hypothetical protein